MKIQNLPFMFPHCHIHILYHLQKFRSPKHTLAYILAKYIHKFVILTEHSIMFPPQLRRSHMKVIR